MKRLMLWMWVWAVFPAYAQHSLKGTVRDAADGKPFPGAEILVIETGQGTTTDLDGAFVINGIKPERVKVRISYTGYQTQTVTVTLDRSVKILDIRLKESPLELEQVVISAGTGRLQKNEVMKVEHVSLPDLTARGMPSLARGLEQIPGVATLDNGTGIGKPVIRGLTGNRVVVFNQGVRWENYQFGMEHGLDIDRAGIRAVEVIKGPASLMYGSDALGGVVYLVPERFAPENTRRWDFSATGTSNTLGYHTEAGYKQSGEKTGFLVRGALARSGDFRIPGGKNVYNSAHWNRTLKTGFRWKTARSRSEIRYAWDRSAKGIPQGIFRETKYFFPKDKYQSLTAHTLSFRNTYHFTAGKMETKAGFTSFFRRLIKNGRPHIAMRLNTWTVDTKYFRPLGTGTDLILGLQTLWQTNRNRGEHYLLPDAETGNAGLFVHLGHDLDNWQMEEGLRVDFHHIHTRRISAQRPAIRRQTKSLTGAWGVVFRSREHLQFRFNLAAGFRAPNLAELTSNGEHDAKIEIGNPQLKNEQNLQADLSGEFTSCHFNLFANGFYNRIYHYIYLEKQTYFAQSLPVYAYRQTDARLYGGEAGIHLHPHPWDGLHIYSSYEWVRGFQTGGQILPFIPADRWKNEIRLQNNRLLKQSRKMFVSLQWNRMGATRNPEGDVFPAYSLIHAGAGLSIPLRGGQLQVFLSVRNLTDKRYFSNMSILQEEGIPGQGRNVILSLQYRFR